METFTTQQQTFAETKRIYWCIYNVLIHQTSNCQIQIVTNNPKFISLDYFTAKKSEILDWRKELCDWCCNHSAASPWAT